MLVPIWNTSLNFLPSGLDSRVEVFPTVLLALPDADLADAAAESSRTRSELALYERPDGDGAAEVEE